MHADNAGRRLCFSLSVPASKKNRIERGKKSKGRYFLLGRRLLPSHGFQGEERGRFPVGSWGQPPVPCQRSPARHRSRAQLPDSTGCTGKDNSPCPGLLQRMLFWGAVFPLLFCPFSSKRTCFFGINYRNWMVIFKSMSSAIVNYIIFLAYRIYIYTSGIYPNPKGLGYSEWKLGNAWLCFDGLLYSYSGIYGAQRKTVLAEVPIQIKIS